MLTFLQTARPFPVFPYNSQNRNSAKTLPVPRFTGGYGFDKFDERNDYASFKYDTGRKKPDAYLMNLMAQYVKPGDQVLELGCNKGNNLLPLAKQGIQAYGVDLSSVCIDKLLSKANEQQTRKNVHAAVCDFGYGNLPSDWRHLKGQLKAITAVHVFSHFSDQALIETVQEFSDYLAPGGVFIATIISPDSNSGDQARNSPNDIEFLYRRRNAQGDGSVLRAGLQEHTDSVVKEAFKKLVKVEARRFTQGENDYWILPESHLRWVVYRKPDGNSCSPVKWLSSFLASGSGTQ